MKLTSQGIQLIEQYKIMARDGLLGQMDRESFQQTPTIASN